MSTILASNSLPSLADRSSISTSTITQSSLTLDIQQQKPKGVDYVTKLYKRRWLVLLAIASLSFNQGCYGWYVPIADILRQLLNIDERQYNTMTQVNSIAAIIIIVPCSMFVSRWGLRKSVYLLLLIVIASNLCKALVLTNQWPASWSSDLKYPIMLVSEMFVGFAKAMSYCIQPKMARDWFANSENTLSQTALYAGVTMGCTTVLFVPHFVKSVDEMHLLSPVFVAASVVLSLLVAVSITRSAPKIAPSKESIVAKSATNLPIRKSLYVMLTNPHYMLLFVILGLNTGIMGVEQLVLQGIFAIRHYDDKFVGIIYALINFSQMIFIIPIARYMDKTKHHLTASRYYVIFMAAALAALNVSINLENMSWLIVCTSVVASLGVALIISSIFKIMYISAVGFMPEQVVGAVFLMVQQFLTFFMDFLVEPLRDIGHSPDYTYPLAFFCVVTLVVNVTYALAFTQPDPTRLRDKVLAM